MITQVEGQSQITGGGGGGITFDGTIIVGDIAKRSGASSLGGYTYSHSGTTSATVGGIPAGTTLTNEKIASILDDMLYPNVGPSVTLAMVAAGGLREYGDTVVNPVLTATTAIGTNNLTSVKFYRGVTLISDHTPPTFPAGGAEVYNTYIRTISTAESYTATADDGVMPLVTSNTVSYTFCYPFYYGVGAAGLSGAQIRAFAPGGMIVQNQANTTRAFAPVAQYYYFAYPATLPDLSVIYDQNGFNITADFTLRNPVSITGLDTTPQNYKVYEFNNITSLSQNLTFNF